MSKLLLFIVSNIISMCCPAFLRCGIPSVSAPPELGDRVANLCASGVPFGARGTVVAIHDPSEGCVEVVMDEEFIGGSTLQGTCANFRGKLCVWNHLLKISAADTARSLDVPQSSSGNKAVVDKLQREVQMGSTAASATSPTTQPKQDVAKGRSITPLAKKARESTRAASAPKSGRQGEWKQALGPPEDATVIGFTDVGRTAKNGFAEWKKMISSRATHQQPVPSAKKNSAASQGLKSLLGISAQNGHEPAPSREAHPVGQPVDNAADLLMNMMIKESQQPSPVVSAPAPQPGFNFTYVKDGDAPPQQNHTMPSQPMMHHPAMMQPQYFPHVPTQQVIPTMMQPHQFVGTYGHSPPSNPVQPPTPQLNGHEWPRMGEPPKPVTSQEEIPKPPQKKKPVPIVPSIIVKTKK